MNRRPARLTVTEVRIPFRMAFSHSAATRDLTQGVWCEVAGDGHRGVGEGCPREYVTGESVASAAAFIEAHREDALACCRDVSALRTWVATHDSAIDANPAAWCALELALLDWLARADGVPVETLLGITPVSGRFVYSAVLGGMGADAFQQMVKRYHHEGFTDFKVKLSGNLDADEARLRALLALDIAGLRIRVDANNLWADVDLAATHLQALETVCPLAGVEEPLSAGDFAAMRRLATCIAAPLVLDESCLRPAHVDEAARNPASFLVNVRVSKMGGLVRSLAVTARARDAGLSVVVGAQVGETSILTRAALPVARAAGAALFAQEGAFGTHLLARDVAEPALMFGAGGVLDADARDLGNGAGWGLSVNSL